MTPDEKNKALTLPANLVDPDRGERGTVDEMASVKRAIEEAGQRAMGASSAIETADASERRRLIDEIHAMRRVKSNVALHAVVSGVKWGAFAWLAYSGFKMLRKERT